ncbi:MAG: class I SAM-dependent methyltransferase [Terracidiphilus sp.]|jgi:SAM-dependent methyltransferase
MEREEAAALWEANAEAWTRHSRAGYDVYRDTVNTPAFLAMLPPVDGLDGLDVGCGEGSNTRKLAQRGARMRAVDIAPTFIRHARETEEAEPLGIDFHVGDGMALPYDNDSFDFATAFMSLMDMPDQGLALRELHRVLRPGGFLQFSILHPCFAPPHRKVLREEDGSVRSVEIRDYFEEMDGRVETWWFSTLPPEEREQVAPFRVARFHRTLSSWVAMICQAGFVIQQFGEPSVPVEIARAYPLVADTRVAGLFLHIQTVKPRLQVL